MMRATVIALLALAAGIGAAVAGGGEASPRGAGLLGPFKQGLKQALMDGMAEGPDAAIAACNVRAPELAATFSGPDVKLGRSSTRLRNPANTPPVWVAPVLAEYANQSAPWEPVVQDLGDGREGYIEPIVVQPLCLTCHGANVAPELAARISELYPQDQATGYAAGDLRGVFWIEYPAAGPTKE